ncbi:MAG: hypothetical protein QM487_04625 [Candidatus Marithrix sp.]
MTKITTQESNIDLTENHAQDITAVLAQGYWARTIMKFVNILKYQ